MRPLVLLVEDDTLVADRLEELLQLDGFDVARVRDGVEALDRLSRGKIPAAIVTDLAMPRMDGLQLVNELATSPRLCRIPLIVLTAWNAPMPHERVRVLLKPQDVLKVTSELRSLLAA